MERDVLTFEAHLTAEEALAAISDIDPATVNARRQMHYPIVGDTDRLIGVVTRGQLETAVHQDDSAVTVADLGLTDPVVTHPDQTLRAVATAMAEHAVDREPVVDRDDPTRIVGLITMTMLLAGRLRDLQEARDTARVLRLRVVRPRRGPSRPTAWPARAAGQHGARATGRSHRVGTSKAWVPTRVSGVPHL